MPYSQPALCSSPPSRSHHSRSVSPHSPHHQSHNQNINPSHSLGRVGHRRSYSSQSHFEVGSSSSSPTSTRFSPDSWSPGGNTGAWSGLGTLPRRHSTAGTHTPTSKFHIGDRRGSSGSSSDDDDDADTDPRLPPLKLKVQVLPSFSERVPFPKTSTSSPVQAGPIFIPSPDSSMIRPTATRTLSSPAVPKLDVAANPALILLSSGKPLRSSLKGSRASSLLNSPAGSPSSTSPADLSPLNSTTQSQAGSPSTSPLIDGLPALSFGSFGAAYDPDQHHSDRYLAPPGISSSALFSTRHVRAQSAPSPPSSAYPSPAPSPLGPLSPSISELDLPMSPGGSTILSPRNVHFPSLPSDLEHVKVFRKDGRPSSLLVTRKERDGVVRLSDLTNGVGTGGEGEGTEGSGNGGEETETETETDREYGYGYGYNNTWGSGTWGGRNLWGAASSRATGSPLVSGIKTQSQPQVNPGVATGSSSFPFPRLPRLARSRSRSLGQESKSGSGSSSSESGSGNDMRSVVGVEGKDKQHSPNVKVELDMSSPVPRPESVRDALLGSTTSSTNVFLEDIRIVDSSQPKPESEIGTESKSLVLQGTFLVRNITFEKQVYARFTMDGWATVSEVRGEWGGSVGSSYLESLIRSTTAPRVETLGDIVAIPIPENQNGEENENKTEWDRFVFRITIPPTVVMTLGRVVEFVGRFSTGGGGGGGGSEWWDNCGGRNWRVGFRMREVVEAPLSSTVAPGQDSLLLKVSPTLVESELESSPIGNAVDADTTATVDEPSVPVHDSAKTSVGNAHDRSTHEAPESDSIETIQSLSTPTPTAEEHIKPHIVDQAVDLKDTVNKGFKEPEPRPERERASKPTGLGSLSGLGGLFWPWKGPTMNAVRVESTSGLDAPNSSLSLTTGSGSGSGSPGKKLAASATVEVLSVIPSPPPPLSTNNSSSARQRAPSVSPTAPSSSKFQFERERISSVSSISSVESNTSSSLESSISSISSLESIDSMLEDVPILERSASLSSVSTDGEGELAEPAPVPVSRSNNNNVAVNLTPEFSVDFGEYGLGLGLGMRRDTDNELTPIQDDARAWPGTQKGFFESGPGGVAVNSKPPPNADPLYNAFIEQWCFVGAGAGNRVR